MEQLARADAAKREAAKQKNELESYIIAMQAALNSDALVQQVWPSPI